MYIVRSYQNMSSDFDVEEKFGDIMDARRFARTLAINMGLEHTVTRPVQSKIGNEYLVTHHECRNGIVQISKEM